MFVQRIYVNRGHRPTPGDLATLTYMLTTYHLRVVPLYAEIYTSRPYDHVFSTCTVDSAGSSPAEISKYSLYQHLYRCTL